MKKKTSARKLKLSKETLGTLDNQSLAGLAGGAGGTITKCPIESAQICSIQHTCVSCAVTDTCA